VAVKPWSVAGWKQLTADLWSAYEDLDHPRRRFALTASYVGPPQELLDKLRQIATIEDDTDLNCEVCFTFHLNLQPMLIVRLSMVGPYAVLYRVGESVSHAIAAEKACRTEDERMAYRAIESSGYQILSAGHLQPTVALALPDHDEVTVYEALFEPEN
jgi:hypothetical protein